MRFGVSKKLIMILLLCSALIALLPFPIINTLGIILLGGSCTFLICQLMYLRHRAGHSTVFSLRSHDPWRIEGIAVPADFFTGEKQLDAVLRLPFEEYRAQKVRSLPHSILFCSALCLMHPQARQAAIIQALIRQMKLDASQFQAQYPLLQNIEVRGVHGSIFQDGKGRRAFFLLDDKYVEQRSYFLGNCTMVQTATGTRMLTQDEKELIRALPLDACLLFTALESELPSQITYLGALTTHMVDTVSEEALQVCTTLQEQGMNVFALPVPQGHYNPIEALQLNVPESKKLTHVLVAQEKPDAGTLLEDVRAEVSFHRASLHMLFRIASSLCVLVIITLLLSSHLPAILPLALFLGPLCLKLSSFAPDNPDSGWVRILLSMLPSLILCIFGAMVMRSLPHAAGLGEIAGIACASVLSCTIPDHNTEKSWLHTWGVPVAACLCILCVILLFHPAWDVALFGLLLGVLCGVFQLLLLPKIVLKRDKSLFTNWKQLFKSCS